MASDTEELSIRRVNSFLTERSSVHTQVHFCVRVVTRWNKTKERTLRWCRHPCIFVIFLGFWVTGLRIYLYIFFLTLRGGILEQGCITWLELDHYTATRGVVTCMQIQEEYVRHGSWWQMPWRRKLPGHYQRWCWLRQWMNVPFTEENYNHAYTSFGLAAPWPQLLRPLPSSAVFFAMHLNNCRYKILTIDIT